MWSPLPKKLTDSLVQELEGNKNAMSRTMLESNIDDINDLFMEQGYDDAGQFMKNVAAAESNLGSDELGDYSFSPFQIDDIRYEDIVQRASETPGSSAHKRAMLANEYLQKELGRPDFDILNLNLKDEEHNPLIGAALTRMGLANIKDPIPSDIEGQATYWKDHWNTEAGAGDTDHFKSQVSHHYGL